MPEKNDKLATGPTRRRRSGMLSHIDDHPLPSVDEESDASSDAVIVDAWDLYHTALGIARHAAAIRDSGWTTLAAVGLRHVFERMKYDPDLERWRKQSGAWEFHPWVRQQWPGFYDLIPIANAYKHHVVTSLHGNPIASFNRNETCDGYSSIFNLANGAVDVSVTTTLSLTEESGNVRKVNIEKTLEDGFAFGYQFFSTYFPEKVARRPLPADLLD